MRRLTSDLFIYPAVVAAAICAVHSDSRSASEARSGDAPPLTTGVDRLPEWHPPVQPMAPRLPPGHPPLLQSNPPHPEGHPRCPARDDPTELPPGLDAGWLAPRLAEPVKT
jgi:hypothetical protein